MTQIKGLLRLEEVLSKIPVSKSTWYAGIQKGIYPRAVGIGGNRVAWRVEDIEETIKGFEYV